MCRHLDYNKKGFVMKPFLFRELYLSRFQKGGKQVIGYVFKTELELAIA